MVDHAAGRTADPVAPHLAAALLRSRGVGLLMAETDRHLIEQLVAAGVRARDVPDDVAPIRAALTAMIEEEIRDPFDPAYRDAVSTESRRFIERVGRMSKAAE